VTLKLCNGDNDFDFVPDESSNNFMSSSSIYDEYEIITARPSVAQLAAAVKVGESTVSLGAGSHSKSRSGNHNNFGKSCLFLNTGLDCPSDQDSWSYVVNHDLIAFLSDQVQIS
jgi:hypothetical protein